MGWKDPFSNAAYMQRQKEYASVFNLSNIYTPQIVVKGKAEFIGCNENKLRNTIEEYLAEEPRYDISLQVDPLKDRNIAAHCSCIAGREDELHLALVQNMSVSQVQRGENRGKTLNHFHIVLGFHSERMANGVVHTSFKLSAALAGGDCTVLAFLQNKKTAQIDVAMVSKNLTVN